MNVKAPPFRLRELVEDVADERLGLSRAWTPWGIARTYTRTRMPKPSTNRKDLYLERVFETRSQAWEKVGLAEQVSRHMVRRARRQAALLLL